MGRRRTKGTSDDKLLARSDAEGRIVIEQLEGREIIARYDHEGGILLVQFVSGGRKLLSSGRDHTVRRWDVPDSK